MKEPISPSAPTGARKDDAGKPRMELLPLPELEEVARVLTFGAGKYAPEGWRELADGYARYKGALLRHLAAIDRGELLDPESHLPHAAHVACNALFMLHFASLSASKVEDEP